MSAQPTHITIFDVNSINGDGNGLANMKNRALEMNADINVSSLEGVGTEVQVICKITRTGYGEG